MSETALVFAGSSFVGGHLARRLRDHGLEVVTTARQPGGASGAWKCDLADEAGVRRVVAECRPRWVFQCAAVTAASGGPALLYHVHVLGALHALAAVARHAPGATVILFGSAAEYGQVPDECLPLAEDQRPGPLSFYGASKRAQTQLASAAAAEWGLRVLVVRPFNVLGPGLPAHYLAGALARRLRDEGPVDRPFPVANGAATRDFVDVRDVAEAVLALAERAEPPRGEAHVYNIASGQETPILAVAARLCALAGGRHAVDQGGQPSRSGVARSRGDASRLRRAVGWAPRVRWEQSVADLWHQLWDGVAGAA
jgi:GDP-4-dehydro-6-deoxy-D-mannose reductase